MLTGRAAFGGETLTDTLAAVLTREIDWSQLPGRRRPLCRLLRRCLKRDPKKRLRDIGDVRLALEGAFETAAPQSAPPGHSPSLGGTHRVGRRGFRRSPGRGSTHRLARP